MSLKGVLSGYHNNIKSEHNYCLGMKKFVIIIFNDIVMIILFK